MAAGGLDLEFAVTLPPGVSEEELVQRLRSQAGRLNELLAQPVMDMRVGADAHHSDPIQGPPDRVSPSSAYRGRPQAFPASRSAEARMDLLNHPTSPIGPEFLRDGSYWQQRQGSRISERKAQDDKARREKEDSSPPPFRARPVPPSVTAPLYQGMQAYARMRRSRSAEPGGQRRGRARDVQDPHEARDSSEERRPASRARKEQGDSAEECQLPFRARPVPWCVSAPLYDQMLIEDQRVRQQRMHSRSRSHMRTSSLPPRLEAVRRRMCGDDGDPFADGSACGYRSSTPVPQRHIASGIAPESRIMNRSMKAELPRGVPHNTQNRSALAGGSGAAIDAAENLSRDVAAGASRVGWGVSSLQGSSYGISHVTRHQTPTRTRAQSAERTSNRPYRTTEVPDFAALHERQRRERMKYSNRVATQPEPFVFNAPGRTQRPRQAPLPKDPSKDPRFHRRPRSPRRSHSASGGGYGGSPPVRAPERPPVAGPPRTTAKTLQMQHVVASQLIEKRLHKQQEEQHIENAKKPDPETKARVRAAIGPVESVEQMVERAVMAKKESQRSTMRDKHRDLKEIAERVNRRPLLMQQTDSVARARRLALFQFRGFLKDAGVSNPDAHFQDEELDELDRARSDAAAAGGM